LENPDVVFELQLKGDVITCSYKVSTQNDKRPVEFIEVMHEVFCPCEEE
jgi:hypothetical protein